MPLMVRDGDRNWPMRNPIAGIILLGFALVFWWTFGAEPRGRRPDPAPITDGLGPELSISPPQNRQVELAHATRVLIQPPFGEQRFLLESRTSTRSQFELVLLEGVGGAAGHRTTTGWQGSHGDVAAQEG